jgi:hypothetical protein
MILFVEEVLEYALLLLSITSTENCRKLTRNVWSIEWKEERCIVLSILLAVLIVSIHEVPCVII